MATQVEVINLALGNIAQAPIGSISEASVQAETAVRVWDPCRKESLGGHDWPFASVVATLSLSATYGTLTTSGLYAGEYVYAYDYPDSCLALWKVYEEGKADKSVSRDFRKVYDHVNSQNVILTNVENALGEYTFDVTDTSFWDSDFITAMSYRLAAAMAMQLTGDPQLALTMMKTFTEIMGDAKRTSSLENNPDKVKEGTSQFIDARGGSEIGTSQFDPSNIHPNG